MKFFISFVAFSMIFSLSAQAQWSFSVNAGAAPGQKIKAQAVSLANLYEGSDFALKPVDQSVTYNAGLTARHKFEGGFFIQTELMYNTSKTEFSLEEIGGGIEINPATSFSVHEHRLSIPISMGADIGNFSALTGISINGIVSSDDQLDNLPGIDDDSQSLYMGWHAGLQYHIGRVGLEVRYVQDFRNHGTGLTYGSKEVEFYGNRNRIMFMASYQL